MMHDSWEGYVLVEAMRAAPSLHWRQVVDHKAGFLGPGGEHIQNVERLFQEVRGDICPKMRSTTKANLQGHLDWHCFLRREGYRRHKDPFLRTLGMIAKHYPL